MKIIEQPDLIMKNFRRIIVFFLLSAIVIAPVFTQEIPAKLLHGFQTGNADELSLHFNERFQLTILSVDYRVSKVQATEILREFFKNNSPNSFSILHKGDKKDSNFAVGKLVTKSGKFRVNIFFRKTEDTNLIYLLEIEKENEAAF
jgi:hypothetical protein